MERCALAFCCILFLLLAVCMICAWEGMPLYGDAGGDSAEPAKRGNLSQPAGSGEDVRGTNTSEVDVVGTVDPLVPLDTKGAFKDQPDAFVDAVYDRSEALGSKLQRDLANDDEARPFDELGRIAQRVEEQSAKASAPLPPQFEPIALDVLPQKYWQPVFEGCQPVFTDARCDASFPTPRLFVTDLNELQYARNLEMGRVNMIEPQRARQAMAQLLSIGVRSRRDIYTQASPANDIPSQSVCAMLKNGSPPYVWR